MKRTVAAIILIILAWSISAQELPTRVPRYEAGVIIGQPTGLSAKYWVSRLAAFDAALAWSFADNGSFEIHASLLYHLFYIDVDRDTFPVYLGLGPVFYLRDDVAIGARVPIGITYLFEDVPLSLFLEIAPVVEVIPESGFDITGGVGVRVVF